MGRSQEYERTNLKRRLGAQIREPVSVSSSSAPGAMWVHGEGVAAGQHDVKRGHI